MSVMRCYWALLSLENFEFIFLSELISGIPTLTGESTEKKLLSQSLLRFIHPEEVKLAEADLRNFVKSKSLAGAVTRCRLRNILSPEQDNWVITDVVMYIATNKTILALFHNKPHEYEISATKTCCGGDNAYSFEPSSILNTLQHYSLPIQNQNPFYIFQIYNTNTQEVVLSWPPLHLIHPPPIPPPPPPSSSSSSSSSSSLPALKILTQKQGQASSTLSFSSNTTQPPQFQQEQLRPENFSQLILSMIQDIVLNEMEKNQKLPPLRSICMHHSNANSTAIIEPFGLYDIERIIICYGNITFGLFQVTAKDRFRTCDLIVVHEKRRALEKRSDNNTTQVNRTKETTTTASSSKYFKGRFDVSRRKCVNCHTSNSPEWRRGPAGHKKLCNACGLRYARSIAKKNNYNNKIK